MRAAVERAARAMWSGEGGLGASVLSTLALPAEIAFRAGVSLRGAAYEGGLLRAERAGVPVVCVGNLSVGGTGKTPLTRWVVGVLRDGGHRPAIVARGYGRDELLLHRRWHPGVPVVADADRPRAARQAIEAGAGVIVLDDGFQHRRLARDLDLVVVSAEQRFPGALLPRGPYREPAGALRRAGWIVLTHRTAPAAAVDRAEAALRAAAPGVPISRVRLRFGGWSDLDGRPSAAPSGPALVATAVADPLGVAALVRAECAREPEVLDFPDHHEFSSADLARIARVSKGRPVVVTEKDAVKLREMSAPPFDARVLTLALDVESGEAALRGRILAAAEA